ncbi:MAG: hypothetical protein HYZ53_30115 [Planctomycetes bacterium]|nr:hypothetical protein [Planctomycetota bacterium]
MLARPLALASVLALVLVAGNLGSFVVAQEGKPAEPPKDVPKEPPKEGEKKIDPAAGAPSEVPPTTGEVSKGPTGRPAHLCDLHTLEQGWRCKTCQRMKDRKGDCCPPPCKCGPTGCPDDDLRLTISCIKGLYACEMGCKGSEAREPGKCKSCGSVLKIKGSDRAEVYYRCPGCGRTERPRPTFTCDHCGPVTATGKGYLCTKCQKPVHVDFVPAGKCPDCGQLLYRNCDKAGTAPHGAAAGAPDGEGKGK